MSDVADQFRAKQNEAEAAYELAATYWRDGALVSAAACLDKAADLARAAQAIRHKALIGEDDPAAAPVVRIPAELVPKLAEFFDRTLGQMHADASFDAQAVLNREECARAVAKLSGEALMESPARG